MELTKFGHACVRITDGDRRLVIDPGAFSEVAEALTDVEAVLITHEHVDHIDVDKLAAAATQNPALKVWAPQSVADQLAGDQALSERVTAVGPGQSFVAGGLQVRTFGGQHALIHSSIPVISNVGYLVGDAVYHPGDSYVVPNAGVEALLVPINAPWSKVGEAVDFTISARAPRAFQIHDGLLNSSGLTLYESQLSRVGQLYGVTRFSHLDAGESVRL
ncbi:MAG TPA: MBL fold metallo-hydrolase [Jatrophihabitans sp.]|jgi:L-ascorbate metabolism protein UlaG (beta-lactamase superfamily)|uniref:MBL fold metallo-hydrolase n=1 Tax=Jatrophihabitans sp. TaxID=1932789 RepID=UPI002F0D1720